MVNSKQEPKKVNVKQLFKEVFIFSVYQKSIPYLRSTSNWVSHL